MSNLIAKDGFNQTTFLKTLGVGTDDDPHVFATFSDNLSYELSESFVAYSPGNTSWNEVKGSGDIITLDGNSLGASYLVISKSSLNADTESYLESIFSLPIPIQASLGLHMSKRTIGQEFSVELVSSGDDFPAPANLTISSISQATTTLSVTTSTPHNLAVGMRIGIDGTLDSRLNYPALVVATVVSSTVFTATSTPNGTIPSVTVGPLIGGVVYHRSPLRNSRNGSSMIFDSSIATNASFYVGSGKIFVLPGASFTTTQQTAVASTASVQPVSNAFTYVFQPTSLYHVFAQQDRWQWSDAPVDATGLMTSRMLRTQLLPNPDIEYKLRIRAVNNRALSIPVGQIVMIFKTGTATATVILDRPHSLSTGDYVNLYGVRDQTNFPNLTAATVVASVVDATTITVVIGSASAATSYGGYVAKINGGNLMSALGAITQVAQSATLSGGILTIVGNTTWTGLLIGDYVDVVGLRVIGTGATLNCEGAWKVRNISAANLELEALPGTIVPTDFVSTNCGGAVIKRTDLRISLIQISNYQRQRVEIMPRSGSDGSVAVPVQTSSTHSNIAAVQSNRVTLGSGWYFEPDNTIFADVASAALTTTTTTTAITPTPVGAAAEFNIIVTAVSGTNPTLDVGIEESDDTGTSWYRIYDFPRLTATGAYRSPVLPLSGNRLRYVQTVGGTTPSFTRAVNRITHQMVSPPPYRQIVDRTVVPNTLNSVTPSLKTNGATNLQLVVSSGAITTTAPVFQLEGSEDNGATWYSIGSPLTAVADSTVQTNTVNFNSELIRARVSTAGVGATLGYVVLKAFGA